MSWTLTHSGQVMDLLDPKPHMVKLDDIAIHLSRVARFSGATKEFYSVADHSVFVSQIVADMGGDEEQQIAALFHDAHEAYIGDIPTPVKYALGEEAGKAIELLKHSLDGAIFKAVGVCVDRDTAHLIKQADAVALATERERFMPSGGPKWHLKAEATDLAIKVTDTPFFGTYAFCEHHWKLKVSLGSTSELIQKVGAGVHD